MNPPLATFTLLAAAFACGALHAETPADFLGQYTAAARSAEPGFAADAARGEAFFSTTHGSDWSCSSCHTGNPAADGRHASTGKRIAPLAPVANPERFTSPRSVEKWFGRNCRDVLDRECSAAEKADVVAYLNSVRP